MKGIKLYGEPLNEPVQINSTTQRIDTRTQSIINEAVKSVVEDHKTQSFNDKKMRVEVGKEHVTREGSNPDVVDTDFVVKEIINPENMTGVPILTMVTDKKK